MKTYLEPTQNDFEDLDSCETKSAESNFETSAIAGAPNPFRLVKSKEIVVAGDFILNKNHEFELWEGPSGFRADSFVMAVYRQESRGSSAIHLRGRTPSTPGED